MDGFEEFCGGKFWDLNVTWNTENPDFTPCFQQTVLAWLPLSLLVILAFSEALSVLRREKTPLKISVFNVSKIISGLFLITVCLAKFIIIQIDEQNSDDSLVVGQAETVALLIQILSYVIYLIMLIYTIRKGMITSGSLFIFFLADTICKVIIARSIILAFLDIPEGDRTDRDQQNLIIAACLLSGSAISLFLNCWSDIPTDPEYLASKTPSPYGRSSFFNRLIFSYCTPLIWQGFRKPLEPESLWSILPSLRSEKICGEFDKNYHIEHNAFKDDRKTQQNNNNSVQLKSMRKKVDSVHFPEPEEVININRKRKTRLDSVFPALLSTYGTTFFYGSAIKICVDLLNLYTPQIMKMMISFAESQLTSNSTIPDMPGAQKEEDWKGYFYGILLLLTVTFQSLLLNYYFERMMTLGLKVRTALISTIYRKSLTISPAAKKESTVGEIVNLMSVDVQRFMDVLPYLNMLWSAPLQIALSTYWMYEELGVATFVGMGILVCTMPINFLMAKVMRSLQLKQMKLKDSRIKSMNEILNGMKVLKLYAWENSFIGQILEIRGREVKLLKKSAFYQAFMSLFWTVAPFLVGLGAFAYFVLVEGETLTAQKAFVTLSYLNIMRMPLAMLPMMLVFLIQVNVSLKRINKFMNNQELDESSVTHEKSENAVTIKDGNFKWTPDGPDVLTDINITVPKGSLTAIVGTVGSGKSSLLSGILGELCNVSGYVNTFGRIAYAPQQAWIQNSTLRENIEFCSEVNEDKYKIVIDACALKSDFDILPAGDQTEIGEKGINLSGGQKQRVSLARAVYSDADLLLLDDTLSAVDAHVGKHIFENVIGPNGLLKGKTRVLVTHGITFLPQSDHIICLSNGRVSEQGSYNELIEKKGAFANFMIEHMNEADDDEIAEEIKEKLMETMGEEELQRHLSTQMSHTEDPSSSGKLDLPESQSAQKSIKAKSENENNEPSKPATGSKLIEKEAAQTGSVKLAVYGYYFKAIGIFGTVVSIFFQLCFTVSSILSNYWLTWWTSDRFGNSTEISNRNMYLGVYGGLGGAQALFTMMIALVIALSTLQGSKLLHKKMLIRIMMSPMSFFDTTPLGRIVNRFAKDVDVCDSTLPGNLRSWLSTFANFMATMISIISIMPIFVVAVVPAAIIFFVIQTLYVRTSRQLKRVESITRSPIYSHFGETITGASTIRAFRRQNEFIHMSDEKVDYNQICYYPSIIANRWLAVRLETIGNLITFGAALYAIIQKGEINQSEVGFVISYSLSVTQVLNWLVRMTADVETNIVGVERIMEYTELPQEAPWVDPGSRPTDDWPQMGNVNIKNFGLRYRPGMDLVIKNINCSILGGEKVGIVGRTGAGKSSLTVALFRIVEAAEGLIEIDGHDISKIGLHDLRNQLTIIPQDPVLFSGTLRMNLDPFNKYKDDEVWNALELSNLKEFVKSLEKGLTHEVTEGGENLSVGQRQLICLARALLRKTKVLILDEATAAVDLETDELIQKTIRKEFQDCTVLTIAHRINTIMDYDKIMVLDKGELIEFDSPDALLSNPESMFHSLAKNAGIVENSS